MITRQVHIASDELDPVLLGPVVAIEPDLVLVFGRPAAMGASEFAKALRKLFPKATVAGCSATGIIFEAEVRDRGCVLTGVKFRDSRVSAAASPIHSMVGSLETGLALGRALKAASEEDGGPGPRAVTVFSQGVQVNGSALIEGLQEILGKEVLITGGLAGGEGSFERTWTMLNGVSFDRDVVALAWHGDSLKLHHGSASGWDPFGLVRKITLSARNIIFRLDGRPALEVYQEYLGEAAGPLPEGSFFLPLSMLTENQEDTGIILNVIGFDAGAGSLIMAGDVPENGLIRMMHSSRPRLIEAASLAATMSLGSEGDSSRPGSSLALLVSCAGRRAVLHDEIDDEAEAVKGILGAGTLVAGFYSHGQIGPQLDVSDCRLQSQTMAIARIEE